MRCLPLFAAILWSSAVLSDDVAAQTNDPPEPLIRQASAGMVAGVIGVVTDEAGDGIEGASVLAMGATLSVVRTDETGRFRLALAPGPYILRAARDGYISMFREAVHVRADVPLTRHITLLRAEADDVVLAGFEQPSAGPVDPVETVDERVQRGPSSPSDTAWRLRHLPRTVLRDQAMAAWQTDDSSDAVAIMSRRAGMAVAMLRPADFNGHVDLLTTSAITASGDLSAADWPRGVAYVVVGAPVGGHGDWAVRASMAGGKMPAWTFVGEYVSSTSRAHAFRAGVSYSAQALTEPVDRHSLASIDAVRRVGGVHVSDQWTVRGLQVDSGFRVARYDYLAEPTLVSGRAGVRQEVAAGVSIVGVVASHMVAPGSDQFAPPVASGVWLPPERTFSSLSPDGLLRPQRVVSYEIGTDAALRRDDTGEASLTLRVRRFSERTSNQIVTLFGLDEASQVGHYYVGSPGGVEMEGWLIGVSGHVAPRVEATVDYSATSADWRQAGRQYALRRAARSTARNGVEQLHDVTAKVDANVPSTATRITVAVRINSGFSGQNWRTPGLAGRFAVEVRQQLPIRPLSRGELNLLFSARTLLHHADDSGGFYDELLTVAPPLRLMSGLQMRF